MRCTIVLEFDDGDGTATKPVEVMRLHRAGGSLSLAEGKSLVNCVVEQLERFCASRRACVVCGVLHRLHELLLDASHCSELTTTLGKVFYCRERWKALQVRC